MRTIFFCLFSILSVPILAQSKITTTGSLIRVADAQKILDHHNLARKEVKVPPLVWNPQLAQYAQQWANTLAEKRNCKIRHRSETDREGIYYGENLFWGSDTNYYKPINASLSWYDEKKQYHYTPIDMNEVAPIGHYTQMIWKSTISMGAGMAVCKDGSMIIVANYDPPGNYIGKLPY